MVLVNFISNSELKYNKKVFIDCLLSNKRLLSIKMIYVFLESSDLNLPKYDNIKYLVKRNYSEVDIIEYTKMISNDNRIIFANPFVKFSNDIFKLDNNKVYKDMNFVALNRGTNIKNGLGSILGEKINLNVQKIDKSKSKSNKLNTGVNKVQPKFIKKINKKENINIKDVSKLDVILVSVNYNKYLEKFLSNNTKIFKNITVSTHESDVQCIYLCEKYNVKYLKVDDIVKDGKINKSIGLNAAIKSIDNPDWILVIDADIIVNKPINISELETDNIYTSGRYICDDIDLYNKWLMNDISIEEIGRFENDRGIGFFQLFNYNMKKLYTDSEYGRYSESKWSDIIFKQGFLKRKTLDLDLIHLGPTNRKWELFNFDKPIENSVIDKDIVFVGIAAIPSRIDSLKLTINSLIDQVHKIGVYLNGWDNIPKYLINEKIEIVKSQDNGDYGDAGKFYWVNKFKGYYFTCDDDIIYPRNYISRTIEKIEYYDRKAVIAFHGSIILDGFKDYYSSKSRRVLSFNFNRPKDEPVHIVGTGTIGFHTSTIIVKFEDFETPNMADIYFARLGQNQNVPFLVQKHKKGEMYSIESENSISKSGINKNKTKLDTSLLQNKIVKSINWRKNKVRYKVLLIGRFDTYKKGGIYKSNHMLREYLTEIGYDVHCIDSMDKDYEITDDINVCIIYPGDTSRPDFIEAENKMIEASNKGIKCCINMSYNNEINRTREIDKHFNRYLNLKSKIYMLTFSEGVKLDPILSKYKDLMVPFPKTISLSDSDFNYTFEEREGIVLGDVAKLENDTIVNGDAQEWIDAIKDKMPSVNLYAYMQYGKKTKLKNLKLVPYMKEGFAEWLSKRRVSVCLNQKLSFEMLPIESQSLGIPAVYRDMPQSLNQWIGHTGICVNSKSELAQMVSLLYNKEDYWRNYSSLSLLNSDRCSIENIKITLDTSLKKIIYSD